MKQVSKGLLLAAIASLGLGACGGDIFDAAKGNISQTQASTAKTQLNSAVLADAGLDGHGPSVSIGASVPTFNILKHFRSQNAGSDLHALTDECNPTTSPASPVDADGDGVHATQTQTWACSNLSTSEGEFGSVTLNLTGTVTETDKDDTAVTGTTAGWHYDYAVSGNLAGTFSGQSLTSNFGWNGLYDLTRASGVFTYTADFKNSYNGSVAGHSYDFTSGGKYSYVMTGTDSAHPAAAGTAVISGFYGLNGIEDESGSPQQVVVKMSSDGLTYDDACSSYYKAGTFTIEDGSSNKIVWTYAACNSVTTTYNGTAL